MKTNGEELLEEIINEMKTNGKNESDVLWVGTRNGEFTITWEKFKEQIKKFTSAWYDLDKENEEMDLVIVGDTWWIELNYLYMVDDYVYVPTFKEVPRKKENSKEFVLK